jgi:hypothetical protein
MSDNTPAEQPEQAEPPERPERTGSVSYQDPSTTVPCEPTLAERRAREHAERERQESETAWWDEQAKRAKRRKRVLIGGAVAVGLVAVLALSYSSSHPGSTQERCVGPDNVVVDASNCVRPAANTSYGGYGGFGGGFFPIFIGNGGRQYHHTYGGSGGVGQVESGGTTVPPRTGPVGATSGSSSGSGSFGSDSGPGSRSGSSTVTRGGFGVRSHGRSRRG